MFLREISSVGRFSNADPVLIPVFTMRTDWFFTCENRNVNRPQILTWPRIGYENRFICITYMYIFGEQDRFSHGTHIRFSEFSVSFIGSSCSSSHLGLLLFSCCYYFSPIIILLSLLLLLFFLLLLLFSHYYCSLFLGITVLFIRITFIPFLLSFFCCCYFSHMVLLFWCEVI
jgi:hypothetical protein